MKGGTGAEIEHLGSSCTCQTSRRRDGASDVRGLEHPQRGRPSPPTGSRDGTQKIKSQVCFTPDSHWLPLSPAESNCHGGGPSQHCGAGTGFQARAQIPIFKAWLAPWMRRNSGRLPNLPLTWDPRIPPPLKLHGRYSSPVRHPPRHRAPCPHLLRQSPAPRARNGAAETGGACGGRSPWHLLTALRTELGSVPETEHGMESLCGTPKPRASFK